MKNFTLARKPYEAPEAEAFIVLLENFCDSLVVGSEIVELDDPEDL